MRYLGYLAILGGCVLLALAAHDQHRGVASVTASRSLIPVVASRADNPETFRGLMAYQWIRASLFLGLGFTILGLCRRADATDPFSSRFAGKREIEKLGRVLDQEEAKRKGP